MFRKHYWSAGAVALVAASFSTVAQGQMNNPNPVSSPGGYASRELSSIYRQGVGTGYSGASLNQIALSNARAHSPTIGQSSYGAGRANLGIGGSGPVTKPFSNYSPGPTVSPYMNLFRESFEDDGALNYQTLVRPMLQQQQFNAQLQRQALETSQKLQQISAQADFTPEGSKAQYPTGHQTTFMNYGHYYRFPNQQRR